MLRITTMIKAEGAGMRSHKSTACRPGHPCFIVANVARRQGAMSGCQARTQAAFMSTDMDAAEAAALPRPSGPGGSALTSE